MAKVYSFSWKTSMGQTIGWPYISEWQISFVKHLSVKGGHSL
jgi:hypothetical protein